MMTKNQIHKVTLDSFEIGKYLVTQKQWQEITRNNPSYFKNCPDCPVEMISWDAVQIFLQMINNKFPGFNFRLPTEAEWEYAARGGQKSQGYKYSGSNNADEVGWHEKNSGPKWSIQSLFRKMKQTHPVGEKKPNELGLYDMSGNVFEWCSDWYVDYSSRSQTNPKGPSKGDYRVVRGGSWNDDPAELSVSFRGSLNPVLRSDVLGFRLARTP